MLLIRHCCRDKGVTGPKPSADGSAASWLIEHRAGRWGDKHSPIGIGVDGSPGDILVGEQQSLTSYGLEATVLHLPGHTRGSIGVLTAEKDLFCGDLMDSMGMPSLEFFIDDMVAARASLNKLRDLGARSDLPWAR
jgi:Zn-dependent hydrolases, including glyoxylases